jgi:arylsulfatase A-like enzyme
MPDGENVSRRYFLGSLGAGALWGAAGMPAAWTPAPVLKNPNILIVMVDQMRCPVWLSAGQVSALKRLILPNILGRIQANSYTFAQHFCAATNCTSSRSALLTGLYVPQTAMYITADNLGGDCARVPPALNPAYPTWGEAVARLNPAYKGNVWWFGKWHLSQNLDAAPLQPYGFNTRTYPGGAPPYNQSPNGYPNEGSDGGDFDGTTLASDAQIAADFIGWLQGQAPASGQPATPWCATVSLINPHDIAQAPAWLEKGAFPPPGFPVPCYYFQPPVGHAPPLYKTAPAPWNYENLQQVTNKPTLQYTFQKSLDKGVGTVGDWPLFLNDYFWLQQLVDRQVGLVLDALADSRFASNTVVVFLADHGEYAGSHGLHDKGSAVYDESLHVPLYVQFPGQAGAIPMNQMCSGVDFFGLICDFAAIVKGQWKHAYPDLAHRQSLWSFLRANSRETRVAPAPVGLPYILHTFDESSPLPASQGKCHIVGLRTKLDLAAGQIGGKLAFYWEWGQCSTLPDGTPPDPEFYDYNPQTTGNTSELGNDYYSDNTAVETKIAQYAQALGSWGTPAAGLIGSELAAPLVGTGTDGKPLSQALATAQLAYLEYICGAGACGSPISPKGDRRQEFPVRFGAEGGTTHGKS